jgi:glycerophosphoryl diester phosphodiesterase
MTTEVSTRRIALLPATTVLAEAKKRGLTVHTWTFRNEQRRLAADFAGSAFQEYLRFFELGLDGLFSEFPDTVHAARVVHRLGQDRSLADCLVDRRAKIRSGRAALHCKQAF